MKRLLFTLLSLLVLGGSFAQGGLEAGFYFGLPVGDARLVVSANFGAEVGYIVDLAGKAAVGARVGYSFMDGEEVAFSDFNDEAPNQSYLTLAATARLEVIDRFWLSADLGYGFGANGFDQNDQRFGIPFENVNGFYYSPRLRYEFSDRLGMEFAYRSILIDDYDASSVTAGVTVQLTK